MNDSGLRNPYATQEVFDEQLRLGRVVEGKVIIYFRSLGWECGLLTPTKHRLDGETYAGPDVWLQHPRLGRVFVEVKYEATGSWDLVHRGGVQFSVSSHLMRGYAAVSRHLGVPTYLLAVVESGVPPQTDINRAASPQYNTTIPVSSYPYGLFMLNVEEMQTPHRAERNAAQDQWWWYTLDRMQRFDTYENFVRAQVRFHSEGS